MIHYVPSVVCAKCSKPVSDVQQRHDPKTNSRYLIAKCHGDSAEVEFVTQIGVRVKIFE